jgi:hypothetical protein
LRFCPQSKSDLHVKTWRASELARRPAEYAHPPSKTLRRAILHYEVESHEVAKKLGQVEECPVYRRDPPASDSLDILLVTQFKSQADLDPNELRQQAFMKKWGAEGNKTMTQTAQHDY